MQLNSLDEWEKRLRPQVAEVDLLGEIGLSEEEVRSLGRLLGDLVDREGWARASQLLREQYPCTYAVFLVAIGAYFYEEGAFWSAVRKATDLTISPTQTLLWGQLFEEIVQTLPVARFPPMGGHRYIGPILAHGGIPDYCLGDFFDHFLQPLVTRPDFAVLSTEEFIQQRLRHTGVVYTTDKPVLRFLEFGGPLAVDFLERCREMALRFAERGEVPSPEAAGLPPRVVREYQAWLEGRARPSLRKRATYRSPVLFLDPWGWGLSLCLPSQPVSAPDPDLRVIWRISPGDNPEIPAEVWREEMDWKTAPHTLPLPEPAPEYRISLVFVRTGEQGTLSEEPLREWRIPGVTEDHPFLWFDPKDGRLLSLQNTLPGDCLWVLRRPDVVLEADPPDSLQVSEQFPRQPWGWSEYIGEGIDLTRAQTLKARWGNRSLEYFVLSETTNQPALTGDNRLPVEDGRPPLYVGAPPNLCVPIPSRDLRLHRWHIEVWNEWPALPEVRASGTLDDLRPEIWEGEAVLDLRAWLGNAPMGTYRVKVRGPLGHKADMAFRILPVLEMTGYEALYLPDGAGEACLLVETDASTTLTLQPGATDCQIALLEKNNHRHLYEVTAGVSRADFPLRFVRQTPKGDSVYVPLWVPIRRLRWMVVLSPEQALSPEWRRTPLRLPLDALEQAQKPLLLVDLFGGAGQNLEVTLSLHDEDGVALQEQKGRWQAGQPYLRFDLAAFLDTLRQGSSSLTTFYLNLSGLPHRKQVSYPVLQVSRQFVFQQIQAESVRIGNTIYLRLRWQAPIRVRHRMARLWPVWRPWEPPLEIPIPDSARDEYRCKFPTDRLVPGKYLLEITTRNPWVTDADPPTRPAADHSVPVLIPPSAVAMRLQELCDQAAEGTLSFSVALETACIRQDIGQEALAQKALQWCFEHLDEADVVHLLALVRAVAGDPDLDRPLRMKLAAARRLRRVLENFRQGLLPETLYREYLAQLPHPSLWSTETCEILLDVDDEPLRFQALRQLVEREHPRGIQNLVRWLQEGRISDENAIALVEPRLPWATDGLIKALPDPAVTRLLKKLAQRHPDRLIIVCPGHWVRCVAGWGRLERIEAADGTSRDEFLPSSPEPGLRLHVLLRAHDPRYSEKVIIHLEEKTVAFPDAKKIYTCSKCRKFSSQDYRLITEEHDRAIHGGISPSFLRADPLLRQLTPLEFRTSPPLQPLE